MYLKNNRSHSLREDLDYKIEELAYAIEEINSTSARTLSTPRLRLSNRPQYELLEKCGGSRSTQNMSENSQKSPSYNNVTLSCGSNKNTTLAGGSGQNGTVGVSQVPSEVRSSIYNVPALPLLYIDKSTSDQDLYIEVDEKEIESRYIEVPNLKSDFDYLQVGHAVMIEPVCHRERG